MSGLKRKSPGAVGAATGASNRWRLGNQPHGDSSNGPALAHARFVAAMRDANVAPSEPRAVAAGGRMNRFHVEGDKRGSRNGWAVLHLDGIPSGAFGSWKSGISSRWCAKETRQISRAERDAMHQRVAIAKAERDAEQARRHKAAAARAARIWRASTAVDTKHPYLVAKRIAPHCARQQGDRLVVRLIGFDRRLSSLQFIGPDGDKKLMTGGCKSGRFIPVAGRMPGASRILICEGFATGATLAEAEPDALVLAAVDAGNLHYVATGARRQWPSIEIVICADADDVGRKKGRAAAVAAGALLSVPEFPHGIEGSDYNDLVARAKEARA